MKKLLLLVLFLPALSCAGISGVSNNLSTFKGVAINLGTGNTGTGTLRTVLANDQPPIPVTQSGTWTVQPGNIVNTTAWKVDGSSVTQPVSASTLPLPTGAATSVKQSDGTQKTQVVDSSGNVISSTSNALNVNLSSGGFATSSNQTTAQTSLSSIATNTSHTTDGTQLSRITNGTQTADTAVGDTAQNSLLTGSARKTITVTALTTTLTIDALGYSSFFITVSAITGAASFAESADNVTFTSLPINALSGTAVGAQTTFSANGNTYGGAIHARYLRLSAGTTISGMVTLSTASFSSPTGSIAVTQSGTWNQVLIPTANPLVANSPTETTVSTTYEASHVIKAGVGILYGLSCYNSKATSQFLLTFNSTTLPADTTVSVTEPINCAGLSNCLIPLNANYGKYYSTGIVWSNSSTAPTKTIGSADMFCRPSYQ